MTRRYHEHDGGRPRHRPVRTSLSCKKNSSNIFIRKNRNPTQIIFPFLLVSDKSLGDVVLHNLVHQLQKFRILPQMTVGEQHVHHTDSRIPIGGVLDVQDAGGIGVCTGAR